jgi:hypothetical protein
MKEMRYEAAPKAPITSKFVIFQIVVLPSAAVEPAAFLLRGRFFNFDARDGSAEKKAFAFAGQSGGS